MKKRLTWIIASALALAIVPVLVATGVMADTEAVAADKDGLPVVGSYDNLKKLLEKNWNQRGYEYKGLAMESSVTQSAPQAMPAATASKDYSTTNTQVQGVDEADIVKTDGTYLYQATQQEVRIVQAYPATEMKVTSRITYDNGLFQPLEMYVDKQRLVVIGQAHETMSAASKTSTKPPYPDYREQRTVKAMIYDIADKKHPRLTRALDVEGEYLSSRKIGASLYLIANNYVDTYRILQEKEEVAGPVYRDSSQGNRYQTIPYSEIRYFPKNIHPDYLMVAGINLDAPKQKMSLSTYLGAGENIYASPDNLYVAVTDHDYQAYMDKPLQTFAPNRIGLPDKAKTTVYRFAMNKGTLSYSGKGTVPGTILNQFSLDEYEGHLRIATTSGNLWRTDEETSKNNLYVLDGKLNVFGKLEGIAPGEKIYSVRFMGERAYMVTFKKVDPLFVIDLHKPATPSILGALKIPGYSDYLHPYDENHIIGFGKEAESDKDWAYYQGMKIALFDVTDVTKPVEMFKTVIGDRGTDSELLSNHKALLFSKEKGLLAFPVTVREWTEEQKAKKDIREYGQFTFQGAYVYQLELKKGFTLASTITHLSKDDMRMAGDGWYESEKNITRILTIQDTLYTVSGEYVKAQQISTPRQLGVLSLTK